MDIASIDLGERASRDLGNLEELMAHIAGEGLKHSITVSPRMRLVLGARRLEACRRLGWAHIPAETVTHVPDALARMDEDAQDACCVHPLGVVDAILMDFAVRELQWWPRDGSTSVGHDSRGRRDGRRQEIANMYGLNGRQYGIGRELVLASRGWRDDHGIRLPVPRDARERARKALTMIHEPGDVHAALRHYRDEKPPPPAPPKIRRLPASGQEASIGTAMSTLAGVTTGLAGATPVNPAIPAETIQRWDRDLGTVIARLTAFRRELRNHDGYRGGTSE